ILGAWVSGDPISGQRVCCKGDNWLGWSTAARETYVSGFMMGYTIGHSDGCKQGTRGRPKPPTQGIENDPARKCDEQELNFSKRSDYFAKEITDFYSRYPQDRDIYPYEVLEQLGKGLSIEEIDKHPFLRHKSSPTKP